MKTTKAILSVVALALLFASCEKTAEDFGPADGRIILNASTNYTNSPQTKTEYSGVDENGGVITSSSQYERIDWVANKDIVRILCAQALNPDNEHLDHADYKIGSPSADHQKSVAGASPVSSDQEMYWGTGDHYFYALYPAAGTNSNYHTSHTVTEAQSNIEPLTGNKAKITGSIPAEQAVVKSGNIYKPNMNYAYMYAAEKTARTADGVSLHFYPLVTTFEFSLRALDDAMAAADLTSLKLRSSSTYMTGGFTATLDADATTPATIDLASSGLGREITVNFPANTRLSKTEYSVVTVLALGVDQTNLTLELNFGTGNDARTIVLKKSDDTAVSVTACKKVYMKLGVPNDAVFEVTPEVVFDWEGNLVSPTDVPTVLSSEKATGSALSWEIEGYYTHVDADGKVVPSSRIPDNQLVNGIPAWLTSVNAGNPGGPGTPDQATEPFPIVCPQQPADVTEEITDEAQALNEMVNVAPKGSATNPWNLSSPTGNKDIIESANSYIVNGPGWYQIPLVMGNGIKNNAINNLNDLIYNEDTQQYERYVDDGDPDKKKYVGINYKGFDGNKQNDWRALFEDYTGGYVQDPHLHKSSAGAGTPTSAYIVWEDVEGLIETNTNGDYFLPAGCITYDSGTDCYWLKFHVASVRQGAGVILSPKSNTAGNEPRQGNAVVAIKDQDGTTMWSYHIWLTDYQLGTGNNTFSNFEHWTRPDDADIIRIDYDYQLMPRHLGWVVYGQTITTSYHPNSVYVNFVQAITGATDVMEIRQEDYETVIRRNRCHPLWQHGRSTPQWSPYGFDETEPEWYGTSPSFTLQETTVAISEALQHPEIAYKGSGYQNSIFASANTITSPHEWKVTLYDGYSHLASKNNSVAPSAPPTNLWDAICSFPGTTWGGSVSISVYHWVEDDYCSPIALWHSPYYFICPTKTIYDPCPSGYILQPAIYYETISEDISFHHSYSREYGFNPRGVYHASEDKPTMSLFTGPDKSNTVEYPLSYYRSGKTILFVPHYGVLSFTNGYHANYQNGVYSFSGRLTGVTKDGNSTISHTFAAPIVPLFEATAPDETVFPIFVGNYDAPSEEKFPYYYPPRP